MPEDKFEYLVDGLYIINQEGEAELLCSPEEARKRILETDGWLIHKPIVELIIKYEIAQKILKEKEIMLDVMFTSQKQISEKIDKLYEKVVTNFE